MSVRATTWALDQSSVQGNDKVVLIALADHADNEGWCFPGQVLLATRLGISLRTIGRTMARLEELGLIQRVRRHREFNGTRTSDGYLLPIAGDTPQHDTLSRDTLSPHNTTTVSSTGEPSVEPPVRNLKRERASRIPSPFVVDGTMRTWAAENSPLLDVDEQTKAFVDHWRAEAGPKASKIDWVAAWRTWMRNGQRYMLERPRTIGVAGPPVQRGGEPVYLQNARRLGLSVDADGRIG